MQKDTTRSNECLELGRQKREDESTAGASATFQWKEGASTTSVTNFPGVSPRLYLSEGHLEKVISVRVAHDTRSHTDKAHSGVVTQKKHGARPAPVARIVSGASPFPPANWG